MKQLLMALAKCHKQKIAHRDIKPENLLIESKCKGNEEIVIKLVDFGLGGLIEEQKRFTDLLGSPMYIAPEILKKEPYDEKVDIWSSGIIMYILLSGSVPFQAANQGHLFQLIKTANFTISDFTGGIWNQISREGKQFISKMLKADPNQRASAEELLKEDWIKKAPVQQISEELKKEYFTRLAEYKARLMNK